MDPKPTSWLKWFIWIAFGVLSFPLWVKAFRFLFPSENWSDAYSALNALFTLLAFIAVILTLHLQGRDLEAQEQELREQRAEARSQSAKSDVFQLLEAWQEVVQRTEYHGYEARAAFQQLSLDFNDHLLNGRTQRPTMTAQEIDQNYMSFYRTIVEAQLTHYFRLLYNIVRFVDEEDAFSLADKRRLMRIVRALLSEPELNLLFWNGLSAKSENFRALIDDHDLVQNFSFRGVHPEEMQLYPKTFARRNGTAGKE